MINGPASVFHKSSEVAARDGLPRIDASNALQYPPPSLNQFRTHEARAPAEAPPAIWYWQLTGEEWLRDGHSFSVAKKRYRRMVRYSGANQRAHIPHAT